MIRPELVSHCADLLRRVFLIALLASVAPATLAFAGPDDVVLPRRGICAHRGANSTHPENTLPAFREAIRLGAHQIELDVHLLKDGSLAVIHDATVNRTTDGHGRVADFTAQSIKTLDAGTWKHARFAGTRVPLLSEALAVMPINVWINVHFKGNDKMAAAVAREVVRQKRTHQVILACSQEAADEAHKIDAHIMICNMDRRKDVRRYVAETIDRKCRFIQLKGKLCTPGDMARLKRSGVAINFFRANDTAKLKKLFAAGVDFPLVDRTAEMINAAKSLGIQPNKPIYRDR